MRLVDRPAVKPHLCAIIPGRGASSEGEGWIDTGNELPGWDPHIYLSFAGVKEAAKLVGWEAPEVAEGLRAELDKLKIELRETLEELEKERTFRAALDVIESKDFRARKRAGRKPKQKPKQKVAA